MSDGLAPGRLGELLDHHLALQARDMVDEENTVQVVEFMLEAGCQETVGLQQMLLAVTADMPDGDRRRALHFGIIFGDRQAAFLVDRAFLRRLQDFRIDEHHRLLRIAFLGDIDHKQAAGNADLDGGETNARRLIHGLQHVVGELQNRVVDTFDGLGDLAQQRIGQDNKRLDRHGLPISHLFRRENKKSCGDPAS